MTDFTESFTAADGDLEDTNTDLTWTTVEPSRWEVVSSQASPFGSARGVTGTARAEHDTTGADQYAEATVVTLETVDFYQFAPIVRFSAASHDGYMAMVDGIDASLIIVRWDAGVQTDLTTGVTVDVSGLPKVLRIEVEGSTIRAIWDGVEVDSTTDTTHTGNTRAGIYGHESSQNGLGVVIDDFAFGDLAAGGITGTGALTAAAAQVSGTGSVTVTGTGTLTAPAAQISGAGQVTVTGAGELTAPAAEVSGAGTIGAAPVTGSGTVTAPAALVVGAGAVTVTATGDLTAPAALVDGAGGVTITGTGALAAPAARVSGIGNLGAAPVTGSGTLVAPAPAATGTGTVTITGSGAVVAPAAVISGRQTPLDLPTLVTYIEPSRHVTHVEMSAHVER